MNLGVSLLPFTDCNCALSIALSSFFVLSIMWISSLFVGMSVIATIFWSSDAFANLSTKHSNYWVICELIGQLVSNYFLVVDCWVYAKGGDISISFMWKGLIGDVSALAGLDIMKSNYFCYFWAWAPIL